MIILATLKYLRQQREDTRNLVSTIAEDFLLARRADCLASIHIPDLFILGAAGVPEIIARVLICLWLNNNSLASWGDGGETDFYRELNLTTSTITKIGVILRSNGLVEQTLVPGDLSACRLTLQPAGHPNNFLAGLASYYRQLADLLLHWGARKQAEFESQAGTSEPSLAALVARRASADQRHLWQETIPGSPFTGAVCAFDHQLFKPVPLTRRSRFYANVPERGTMLVTGLTELEVDILLTAWELKGKAAISRGSLNLASQLHTSRERILRGLEDLLKVGWCTLTLDEREIVSGVKVESPDSVFRALSDSSQRMAETLDRYAETLPDIQKATVSARISTLLIPKAIKKQLTQIAGNTDGEVRFGFLLGECRGMGCFEITSAVEVPVKSDPHKHYSLIWPEYHRIRKDLEQNGQMVIAEWHTHLDGDARLHPQDLRKMKMLRRGYSVIVTSEQVCCYFWQTRNGSLEYHNVRIVPR